ncbi:conjugal transfer protein TraG N-terminal domain-containing protein [Klebsiella pneumoniae]
MVDYRKDVYRHLGTHCINNWVKKHNVRDLTAGSFPSPWLPMLAVIRTPVQIIDYSNVAQVYEVDNVPIGLAILGVADNEGGKRAIQSYEMVFALPDSVTYSKTGMLFGSNLVAKKYGFFVTKSSDYDAVFRLRTKLCDGRYFPQSYPLF